MRFSTMLEIQFWKYNIVGKSVAGAELSLLQIVLQDVGHSKHARDLLAKYYIGELHCLHLCSRQLSDIRAMSIV